MLDLANRSLATAQLCTAVMASSSAGALPDDVRVFLLEVQSRNRERNRRLVQQLKDALRALNAARDRARSAQRRRALGRAGPMRCSTGSSRTSIFSCADPKSIARSVLCATRASRSRRAIRGTTCTSSPSSARPDDVGLIDLHQRPPGPPGLAEIDNLTAYCTPVSVDGLRAIRPLSAVQIFFLVLHDQLHDGDYWRGGFDLRHLVDIASLSRAPECVDWGLLERCAPPVLSATRSRAN